MCLSSEYPFRDSTFDAMQLYTLDIVLPYSDFGYYRPENSSECVEQEEIKGRPLEFCLNGTTEQLQTSG